MTSGIESPASAIPPELCVLHVVGSGNDLVARLALGDVTQPAGKPHEKGTDP